jgi:hypothetical protein
MAAECGVWSLLVDDRRPDPGGNPIRGVSMLRGGVRWPSDDGLTGAALVCSAPEDRRPVTGGVTVLFRGRRCSPSRPGVRGVFRGLPETERLACG